MIIIPLFLEWASPEWNCLVRLLVGQKILYLDGID
jgi:hypothetical protein